MTCDHCHRAVPLIGMAPGHDGKEWGLCWSCWAPAPKAIVSAKPAKPAAKRPAAAAPRGGLL